MCHDATRVRMSHLATSSVPGTVLHFGSLEFIFDGPVKSPTRAVFTRSGLDTPTAP